MFSGNAQAAYNDFCMNNITAYQSDSHAHRVTIFDQPEVGGKLIFASEAALKKLFRKFRCPSDFITGKVICGEVIKGLHQTEVCYQEEFYGYFLFTRDYLENIHVIYNRWD